MLLVSNIAHSDSGPAESESDKLHLVRDIAPETPEGRINVVIEIPAGTNAKWEVQKDSGLLGWEQRNGRPRIVQYLPYPGNYGMVPQTLLPKELGGDGDPLDVIVLGPALTRGSVVEARLIGVLELLDRGEQDDKLIAVLPEGPLGNVSDLAELDANFAGISEILRLWFSNYKGPGKMSAKGFGDRAKALKILEAAIAAYPHHED
jgi:inorganic pyrophosphatase